MGMMPTKVKKGKAKKGGKSEVSSKPIKHNAETFRLFDQLKLNAPITTAEIPALLEELEKQLESYKEKVKEWEVKREEMKRKIMEGLEAPDDKPAEEEEAIKEEEKADEEEEKEEDKAEED